MELQDTTEPSQPEPTPGTLGAVLYARRSGPLASEREWADLVRAVAAGEQLALHGLYDRAHRLVFTLAMRITGDRETAEEITIDVFHDVWRRSADYDPADGSVLGWIMNQARSRAIDRLRFDHRKKRVPAPGDVEQPRDAAPGASDAIEAGQRRDRLHRALDTLTRDERQAIETAFFGELSYSETALRLEQPLGTVKTRVRSALTKLREALAREGDGS